MLEQLRTDAEHDALDWEINWDVMDKPNEREYLLATLNIGNKLIPELERLWTKLSTGESVLIEGQQTSLPYEDIEKYRMFIEEELYGAYLSRALLTKIELVENIISRAALDN